MLLGYMRVSKADGSQLLDLQRDALLAAGVAEERLYEDRASGRRDDRPGLVGCLKALQPGKRSSRGSSIAWGGISSTWWSSSTGCGGQAWG